MANISKETLPERTKNFKINTRIVITSVLGILIPIILIAVAAAIVVFTARNSYELSAVTTNSYSIINQLQWGQAINDISEILVSSSDDEIKREQVASRAETLETRGTYVYIEKNGSLFYTTTDSVDIALLANEITSIKENENSYYFGESGVVISTYTGSGQNRCFVLIVNENYNVPDSSPAGSIRNMVGNLTGKSAIIFLLAGLTFAISIVVISLITSKTIINPIRKISRAANEIASGNLDYEIEYSSTNELGQLADSFNDMRIQVKRAIEQQAKADQKQKEMIAGVAHDLRTPLTSVKGYVEGLRDGIASTPEKQKSYINTIYDSTCSMEKMLNDLLTISKLELGTITLNCERVRISDFIAYAQDIKAELEKFDFDFEIISKFKADHTLFIDTDRFVRVVNNLVSNSIKYRHSDERGKITLSISEYERSVIFEFADNGMGVDEESLPRIFDTLYRADKARSNVSDGSGLGLAVCKQIVELHHGMIWAKNNIAGGLSIFISLPAGEENI